MAKKKNTTLSSPQLFVGTNLSELLLWLEGCWMFPCRGSRQVLKQAAGRPQLWGGSAVSQCPPLWSFSSREARLLLSCFFFSQIPRNHGSGRLRSLSGSSLCIEMKTFYKMSWERWCQTLFLKGVRRPWSLAAVKAPEAGASLTSLVCRGIP